LYFEHDAWRANVDQKLDQVITLLQQQGISIPMTITEAKAALDAEIAKAAAQNAADFQTLDTAVAANTEAVGKVAADITALIARINSGDDVDVSAELAAIQTNADNATQAAQTLDTAVGASTAVANTADQATNPPDPSDMDAPKT
jgi:hypothetical protein